MATQNRNFQIVLEEDEYQRWLEVLRRAKGRDPRFTNTDVNKRLLGLLPPDDVVTRDDIKYFQNRVAANSVIAREGKPEGRKGAGKGRRRVNGDDDK